MSRHQPTAHGADNTFPTNIPDLMLWLEKHCAEPMPRPGQTLDEVMFAAGRRDLARQIQRQAACIGQVTRDFAQTSPYL